VVDDPAEPLYRMFCRPIRELRRLSAFALASADPVTQWNGRDDAMAKEVERSAKRAVRQRVATAYGWRLVQSSRLPPPHRHTATDIEAAKLSPSAGGSQLDWPDLGVYNGRAARWFGHQSCRQPLARVKPL